MTTGNSCNLPVPVIVADGGTGTTSFTPYAVICGGTTITGPFQSIASVGSLNQVLTSNGTSALPTFQSPIGSALIAQVTSTALTTQFSSSATSYTDLTGLSVAITPSSSSNQVLIMVHVTGGFFGAAAATTPGGLRIMRGSTAICIGDANSTDTRATGSIDCYNGNQGSTFAMMYLDSPATTSTTTYKIQFINGAGSGTFYAGATFNVNNSSYCVGVCSITVMEIVG